MRYPAVPVTKPLTATPAEAVTRQHFHLLIVDQSPTDAALIVEVLKSHGMRPSVTHVRTSDELTNALSQQIYDIAISDHGDQPLASLSTVNLIQNLTPDTPIIVIGNTLLESAEMEAIKLGAQDYVSKQRLMRLVPVIARELRRGTDKKIHRETERNLAFLSHHDTLTHLLNRSEFERRLEKSLHEPIEGDEGNVLMQVDVYQFKLINDSCGHLAGDELLRQTARLLKHQLRGDAGDAIARLGGDEFGILLKHISKQAAFDLARRMSKEISGHRFRWGDAAFSISISIGIMGINPGENTASELLASVDIACGAAREQGHSGIQWYQNDDVELTYRRSEMQWVPRIKKALENDKFVLFAQTMCGLQTSRKGLHQEFLLRLNDEGELVPPGAFIPAAERYRLMGQIDRWVVHNVFKYLAVTRLGQEPEGTFFINLSGATLSDPGFFSDIDALAAAYQILPERICFEITETAAIENMADSVEFIKDIRGKGYKFALDDFGAGMSSFSYLKMIPVDYLKIDGSFVKNLLRNPIDRGIVEACNGIAHAANLQTVAEFVEDDDCRLALQQMGVDFAQGFGISRPGPLNWSANPN